MIEYLTSRDGKYKLSIEITENKNLSGGTLFISDPIFDLFYKSVSLFPIINLSYEKEHINLICKEHLSIELNHEGKFTPSVDLKAGKIKFHINFLKFLWSMCYCLFTYANEIIDLEWNKQFDGDIRKLKNIKKIYSLLEWSENLKNSNNIIEWKSLSPYPCKKYNTVNDFFHIAIAFIYYHELSHILLDHNPNHGDASILFDQEKDADNYALSIILGSYENNLKIGIGIGVCLALSCNLFLNNKFVSHCSYHPGVDQRLFNAIEYFALKNFTSPYDLKRFVTIILEFYLKGFDIFLSTDNYKSTNELYDYLFKIIDSHKLFEI